MGCLDTSCPYPTPKIARIKDGKLGLLRYVLMFIIVVYVVGFQIMWRGNHLETQELTGVYQLQLDTPTKNNCDPIDVECQQNFTSMAELSYCAQSPESGPIKLPCQYWDAQQLGQLTDQGLMIPTHISTFYQTAGCKPSAANNWTCVGWLYDFLDKKGNVQEKRGQASPIDDIFIADIERYTLTIDHSVRSSLGQRNYASDMSGYWLECNHENQSDAGCEPRPIACAHDSCREEQHLLQQTRVGESRPKFRGDRRSLSLVGAGSKDNSTKRQEPDSPSQSASSSNAASTAAPRVDHLQSLGAVSVAQGDIFTIGMLLRAANVSLDKRRHHVPSWVGGSYRSSGFVLVIRIHYTNIESWLGLKVLPWKVAGPTMHYTYRITKHASHDDFMLRQVHDGTANDPKNARVVKEFHGVRVLVEQSGTVAVWDNIQLLLILTTTLALMAVSNCITDSVALYCMPSSDEYWAIKYERPRTRKASRKAREAGLGPAEEQDVEEGDDDIMHYSSITM